MPADTQDRGEKSFRGIPVSAGVCRGKILVLGRARPNIAQLQLTEAALAEEVNRLERALVQTRHQILEIQRKVSEGMGAHEGSIFDAHLLVLEDRTLLDEVVRVIQEQKVNAEHAFHTVAERYAATLSAIEDEVPAGTRHGHAGRDGSRPEQPAGPGGGGRPAPPQGAVHYHQP